MLEIVVLIFITREIGRLATRKGLPSLRWKIYTVVAWIAFEIVGFIISLFFFAPDNYFSIMMVGLMFAVTSYFLIKSKLNKMPDEDTNNDIDNIGH